MGQEKFNKRHTILSIGGFPLRNWTKPASFVASLLTDSEISSMEGESQIKGDKIIVKDAVYTVETINKLPSGLNPADQSTRQNNRVMVVHGAASPFSNSFPCSFKDNGVICNNVEQCTLYHKAIAVKDDVTATRMLGVNNISEQRRLGKSIPSFPLWRGRHREKTETGNELKFSQNTSLAQTLKNTGTKKISETNGFDIIYGTGVCLTDQNTLNDNAWAGENVMGQIFTSIRQGIAKVEALKRSYTSFYITAYFLLYSPTTVEMKTLMSYYKQVICFIK